MIVQSVDNTYAMRENQLMRIDGAHGWVVSCEAGILLITQPGFNRDFVLREGENLHVATNGRVLVGAGTDARFSLAPPYKASKYAKLISGDAHFAMT